MSHPCLRALVLLGLAALVEGCGAVERLRADQWRREIRSQIEAGQYDRAIAGAEARIEDADERVRNAALSLLFGARLAQLRNLRGIEEIRESLTAEQLLGQVARDRRLPPTPDADRGAIVHRAGFDEGLELAGPALRAKLDARIGLLELKDAPVAVVLERLFTDAQINILANPGVLADKRVTMTVRDITVAEVLEHLAEVHGFHYRVRKSSILVRDVANPTLITRTYRLRRGLTEWDQTSAFDSLGDLGLLVASNQAEGSSGGATARGRRPASRVGQPQLPGDELGSRSFMDILLGRLPQLVPWPAGSELFLDRRNNMLVVRSTPATLHRVGKLFDQVDVEVPQILIETRYLEIDSDDQVDLGVEWTVDARFEDADLATTPTGDVVGTGTQARNPASEARSFFGLPVPGGTTTGSDINVVGIFDDTIVSAALYALERLQTTNTLATPHVIAANNNRAQIAIVRNLTFIEEFEILPGQVSQTDNTVLTTPTTVRAVVNDRNYTGVLLNVKPSVGADGRSIHIVLQPVIREQVGEILIENGAIIVADGEEISTPPLTRPILETRLTTTQLTVADGATIVLGGLRTARDATVEDKIPVLGDIPLLGFLFRRDVTRRQKRNLLIFVTARIVNPRGGRYVDGTAAGGPPREQR